MTFRHVNVTASPMTSADNDDEKDDDDDSGDGNSIWTEVASKRTQLTSESLTTKTGRSLRAGILE